MNSKDNLRSRPEELVADISTRLVSAPVEQIDTVIGQSIGRLGQILAVDRCSVFRYCDDGVQIARSHFWHASAAESSNAGSAGPPGEVVHRLLRLYGQNSCLCLPDIDSLPSLAGDEKDLLRAGGVVSLLAMPLAANGKTIGLWVMESTHERRDWSQTDTALMQIFAGMLSSVLHSATTEATLAREQQLMRLLLDTSPDYIYFKDRDSRFTRISRSLARLYGIDSPEQAIGKSDYDFYPRDNADAQHATEQRLFRTGEPIISAEERQVCLSGDEGWVSTTKLPLTGADGRISGLFGISRDISSAKAAEQRVGGLLAEKELLLREAYHRIKNDMNMVCSLLSLQASTSDNLEMRQALEDASSRVSVIAQTYDQVYRRGDLGSVALRPLITAIVHNLHQIAAASGCAIDVSSDESVVSSRASIAIGIIINEMVTNSLKHAFEGVAEPRIEIDSRGADDNRIALTICDNGNGFPGQLLRGGQLGYGTTIVKALVEQHRGTLELSNDRGARALILLNGGNGTQC